MSVPKILLVEDNPADIYILRHSLTELGEKFEMEIAPDGERALDFVHNQWRNLDATQPCVIVLDLHLPKHDGIEVLQAIRKEPLLSHVHVMVMTSSASPQEEAELRRLGAYYRTKPRELGEFTGLAADLIAICKGAPAIAS